MIIKEDVYLEHHGVKGQKWGVRNKKPKKTLTSAQKARRVHLVISLARVAVGFAFLHKALSGSKSGIGGSSLSQLQKRRDIIEGRQVFKPGSAGHLIKQQEMLKNQEFQKRAQGAAFINDWLKNNS